MRVESFITSFLLILSNVSIQILNRLTYILRVRGVCLDRIVLKIQVLNVVFNLAPMSLVA